MAHINTFRNTTSDIIASIIKPRYGLDGAVGDIESLVYLISFNLNGTATVPSDGTGDVIDGYTGTDARYPRVWDETSGLVLSPVYGKAFISEGMRYSVDTTEDGVSLGSELVANGDFTNGSTGWTFQFPGTHLSVANEQLVFTNADNNEWATQAGVISATAGLVYAYSIDIVSITGNMNFTIDNQSQAYNTTGTKKGIITTANSNTAVSVQSKSNGFNAVIDNVSIKLITPAFLNSVSKADSTKLHPSATKTDADGNSYEVMLSIGDWADSTVYAAGATVVDFDGTHWRYYSTALGGTSSGTGVADDTGVTDWLLEGYYMGRIHGEGGIPHVINEPSATNLALQSQNFGTTWAATNLTVDANTTDTTAPDGTNTADKITDDATSGHHYLQQLNLFTVDGNKRYWSLYVKAGTGRYIAITSYAIDYTADASSKIIFDTTTGEYSATSTNSTSIEPQYVGDGWWRIAFSSSLNSANYDNYRIEMNSDGTHAGSSYSGSGSTMYIWQSDLTSSYGTPITTTTSTATRPATDYEASPTISDYLRFRISPNDLTSASVWISDSTNKIGFDGTNVYATDGTNSASAVQALSGVHEIGWDATTGKLYFDNSVIATNASVSITWGATIQIGADVSGGSPITVLNGGVTDWYTTSSDPDLTDASWRTA